MSDDNKITGPGYYPRRPSPPPRKASYKRVLVQEPITNRYFNFMRQRSAADNAHRGIGASVIFEARDRDHAIDLARRIGIVFDNVTWFADPAGITLAYRYTDSYVHYLDGRIDQPMMDYSRMWAFVCQSGVPAVDSVRGLGQVIIFEAGTGSEAEALAERVGVVFDGAQWFRSPYRIGLGGLDAERSSRASAFVHWSDGDIEPWLPLPTTTTINTVTFTHTVQF